jgi:Cdc6-related protein, AAA superfamily ATPase
MNNEAKETPEKPVETLRILDADYIPERIIHRNDILEPIARDISVSIQHNADNNIAFLGPLGSGRYTLAMDIRYQLEEYLESLHKTLLFAIIDFSKHKTKTQMISEILRQVDPENPVIKGKKYSHSSEDILDEKIASNNVFLLVLKNIDQMKDDYILRYCTYFSKLKFKKTGSNKTKEFNIITLTIARSVDWLELLDSNLLSRFRPFCFKIPRLSEKEIYEILKQRVEALSNKTLDDEVIEKCAKAGAKDGNTDFAIRLLKSSIIIAEKSYSNHITLEHFDRAFAMAVHEENVNFIADQLKYLSLQRRLILNSVLELLENNNFVTTGQVYEHYLTQCKILRLNPISTKETFSENITYLEIMDFIHTQMMYRGRKGNTRQISIKESELDLMKEAMTKVLREQFKNI